MSIEYHYSRGPDSYMSLADTIEQAFDWVKFDLDHKTAQPQKIVMEDGKVFDHDALASGAFRATGKENNL